MDDEKEHNNCFIIGLFMGGYLACELFENECLKPDMTIEKLINYINGYKNFNKIKFIQNSNQTILGFS